MVDGALKRLAKISVASVSDLIRYPPEAQTAALRSLRIVPPVRLWATFDANGRSIARNDDAPLADMTDAPNGILSAGLSTILKPALQWMSICAHVKKRQKGLHRF